MLYGTKDLMKCKLRARDGELGRVVDLAFDERDWSVRAVVAQTGRWLPGRKVLIPREKVVEPNWKLTKLDVDLTREEIETSPGVATNPPLSYDLKSALYKGVAWSSHAWGGFVGGVRPHAEDAVLREPTIKTYLRSASEITKYRIEAEDGRIGHVEDFLFSGDDWNIHYVVVDTRNWLPGKKVAISPAEVLRMNWGDQTAEVALTKAEIRHSDELDPSRSVQPVGTRLLHSK